LVRLILKDTKYLGALNLAEGVEVVTHIGEALREGRAARAIREGKR